jgi:hypothetical protein
MIMMEDGELTKKSVAEMEEWQRQGLKRQERHQRQLFTDDI